MSKFLRGTIHLPDVATPLRVSDFLVMKQKYDPDFLLVPRNDTEMDVRLPAGVEA